MHLLEPSSEELVFYAQTPLGLNQLALDRLSCIALQGNNDFPEFDIVESRDNLGFNLAKANLLNHV